MTTLDTKALRALEAAVVEQGGAFTARYEFMEALERQAPALLDAAEERDALRSEVERLRAALANMGNLATTASEFESQRNAALNEVDRLRDENARLLAFASEASALDCGCVSGDCPHMDKADCRDSMEALLREAASDARAALRGEVKP